MRLNEAGHGATQCWLEIPNHFPHVVVDEFVVMPNHVHGILVISHPAVVRAHEMGATGVGNREHHDDAVRANDDSPLPDPTDVRMNDDSHLPTIRGTLQTIGAVVRGYKIGVTKWMRASGIAGHVWQRNYYEHIIRHEPSLNRIRQTIIDNPATWASDENNPNRHEAAAGANDDSAAQREWGKGVIGANDMVKAACRACKTNSRVRSTDQRRTSQPHDQQVVAKQHLWNGRSLGAEPSRGGDPRTAASRYVAARIF
jgi:REP element-mobilizing transposase RayT